MLAILGLFGLALSAVMMTGQDIDGADEVDLDTSDGEPTEAVTDADVISLGDLLGESEAGFSDDSGEDINHFSGDADDLITTGTGNDLIESGDGNDVIDSGAGDDEIQAGLGDDFLRGGDGNDQLFGHVGNDRIFGDAGNDALNGGDGADQIEGGEGDDQLLGSLGNDTLIGGNGADVLFGGSGDDVLDGRDDDGKDFLNGGAGDDRLIAGFGDHMNGGDGADQFVMDARSNAIVDDFNVEMDSIEISYDSGEVVPTLSYHDTEEGVILMADDTAVATFSGLTVFDLQSVPVVMTAV